MLALAGILIAIVGALGTIALVSAAGQTHPVLAVAKQVDYGQQISADDLTVVNIQAPNPLQPVPAGEKDTIVGQYAAAPLIPGGILVRTQISKTAVPAAGKALVSLSMKAGTLPARQMQPLDQLQLVVVPDNQDQTTNNNTPQPLAAPATFDATVFKVGSAAPNGDTSVDVEVSKADAPLIASLAAQGRLAITVAGR